MHPRQLKNPQCNSSNHSSIPQCTVKEILLSSPFIFIFRKKFTIFFFFVAFVAMHAVSSWERVLLWKSAGHSEETAVFFY